MLALDLLPIARLSSENATLALTLAVVACVTGLITLTTELVLVGSQRRRVRLTADHHTPESVPQQPNATHH